MGKAHTAAELADRIKRGERLIARMWDGVSPERRKQVEEETAAAMEWWLRPIGVGLGTREATIRERLMLYHARYCYRKYALWDLLVFWAKWSAGTGPDPETPEGDLCQWLDWELDRADRNHGFREANITATLMVVLTLMREQYRANAAPEPPPWDEDAERAAMMTARATRAKVDAEVRAAGEDIPSEHPCIRKFFALGHMCPPAFFAHHTRRPRKGVRRGTA